MNLELFNELMAWRPSQHEPEWRIFLEICELYIKKNAIENPIVVEIGVWRNRQKPFYEQLLGARHIGIDISTKRSKPDIHGDSHNAATLDVLKERLNGKPINILFIDGAHRYEDVRMDFEMYAPLCSDIIAFHDTEFKRYDNDEKLMVWKFWDELKKRAIEELKEYGHYLFLSISQCHFLKHKRGAGIGLIIKR